MLARVLHLVRYDLQSVAPLLGVWIGVLALESLVLWIGPPAPDPASRQTVSLDLAAIVIRFAVTVVLVATLVHRHVQVGTTAFWRTRPVARPELLLAKASGITALAVALPAAWFAATFLGLGLGGATVVRAVVQIGVEQAFVAAAVVALAGVSSNMAQVVVGGVAMLTGFAQLRMYMAAGQRRPQPWTVTIHDTVLAEASFFILAAVVLAAVAAYHLLTLRRWRAVGLLGAVVVLAVLQFRFPLVMWWPAPLPQSESDLKGLPELEFVPSSMRSEHFTRVEPGGQAGGSTTAVRRTSGVRYSAQVREVGQAGALFLSPARFRTRVTFADGETVAWASPWRAPAAQLQPVVGGGTIDDQPYASLAAATSASLLLDPRDVFAQRFGLQYLEVSDDDFRRKRSTPGVLDVDVAASVYRYSLGTRVPATVPARAELGDPSFVFRGRVATENGVAFDVSHVRFPSWGYSPDTYYLLLHERRHEAVLLAGAGETTYRTTLMLSGLTLVRRRLDAVLADRPALAGVDDEWLRGAEIVVALPEPLGRVDRTIRVEPFLLDRRAGLPADPAGVLSGPGGKQ